MSDFAKLLEQDAVEFTSDNFEGQNLGKLTDVFAEYESKFKHTLGSRPTFSFRKPGSNKYVFVYCSAKLKALWEAEKIKSVEELHGLDVLRRENVTLADGKTVVPVMYTLMMPSLDWKPVAELKTKPLSVGQLAGIE